ncbi:MAG: ferredoxin family protein [Ardenticatenaceae bacterium]|nr:ferredoxin family protein [Anaerolineales bacterium]MCB8977528.1 ferredoxin family protein [Ardenticatenaceae bacterium]
MTHIVTRLCLRDTACVDVCPVECMVLGKPEEQWPWLYIDPDTCIDCGACVPECPYEAIFPEEEVPFDYEAAAGVWIANTKALLPDGAPLSGEVDGHQVNVKNAKQLSGGEILDLTEDIPFNYDFYSEGPGYDALD